MRLNKAVRLYQIVPPSRNPGKFQTTPMPKKYKNQYRIESNRLPGWDYSNSGYYFITIVTRNRLCNLGKIVMADDRAMVDLSDFGKIVDAEWKRSFEMREELFCAEYIVMPNHLHAIIVLDRKPDLSVVETHGRASLHGRASQQPQFIRKPKSISSFIGGFKSAVNSKIDDYIDANNLNIPKYNRKNHFFQTNYWDHVIRNENEYGRIAQYIIDNPAQWEDDKLNGGTGNKIKEPIAIFNAESWMV